MDSENIQKILRLKNHESPEEGYFDDFLQEFQCRQRAELLNRSSRSLFIERVGTWMGELNTSQWLYGAGLAYAVVFFAVMLWPESAVERRHIEAPTVPMATSVGLEVKQDVVLDFPSSREVIAVGLPQEF